VLHGLAQQLRAKRFASGAFGFERVEVQFDLDEAGKPIGIKFRDLAPPTSLLRSSCFWQTGRLQNLSEKY
jgi:ribonuclease R